MNAFLSPLLIVAFSFTTIFADIPQARAATAFVGNGNPAAAPADGFAYSAYRRPNDRAWNRAWTKDLLSAIAAQKSRLESASDIEAWCPGYHKAAPAQQTNCFVRLFTGISAWESSNTPWLAGDHGRSTGLMQIGSFNCRRERFSPSDLKTPAKNLACGARLAADLIARDGVISSERPMKGRWGTTRTQRLGLGRGGWTVMMRSQTMTYRGRTVQMGHLTEIATGMKGYLNPRTGTVAVLETRRKLLG